MLLRFRPAVMGDFDAFCVALYGGHPHLWDILHLEWKVFLRHSRDLTMIVEDLHRSPNDLCVGLAQTVFVTDEYVKFIQSGAPPYANQHASNPLPDGSEPLLSIEQIREANSTSGLNALTTRWGWRQNVGTEDEERHLRVYMDRNYELFYRGYRYRYLLMPANGLWPCQHLIHAGYTLLTDYAEHYPNEKTIDPSAHPYLLHAHRDWERREGNTVNRAFDYSPPRFYFKPNEQELLWAAILGLSDRAAADRLCVGPDAIKKRWDSIYDRVQEVDSELLPASISGTRGAEKRRLLLAYILDHLEELRPCGRRSNERREIACSQSF
jgi:hypothetical protein